MGFGFVSIAADFRLCCSKERKKDVIEWCANNPDIKKYRCLGSCEKEIFEFVPPVRELFSNYAAWEDRVRESFEKMKPLWGDDVREM